MHKAAQAAEKPTDSMRMFLMGVEGGKPKPGETGVQPEWFYKGDGSALVASGDELVSPSFAEDGGEEPELAGIYLIGPDGTPFRLGFCLANEFSDHVTEKQNYLWLAHSKLRQASLGPELYVGDLPDHVEGVSRIRRGDQVVFEKPFLSVKRTCRTRLPIWNIIISNMNCSVVRAIFMSISSARQPCLSRTA